MSKIDGRPMDLSQRNHCWWKFFVTGLFWSAVLNVVKTTLKTVHQKHEMKSITYLNDSSTGCCVRRPRPYCSTVLYTVTSMCITITIIHDGCLTVDGYLDLEARHGVIEGKGNILFLANQFIFQSHLTKICNKHLKKWAVWHIGLLVAAYISRAPESTFKFGAAVADRGAWPT